MTSQAIPPIYKFHVWIRQISRMIWRRILVRSESSIAQLHDIIQFAFGWSDSHLHRFRIHGRDYGVSRPGGPWWSGVTPETDIGPFGAGEPLLALEWVRHERTPMAGEPECNAYRLLFGRARDGSYRGFEVTQRRGALGRGRSLTTGWTMTRPPTGSAGWSGGEPPVDALGR
jgi:hypothetical protein